MALVKANLLTHCFVIEIMLVSLTVSAVTTTTESPFGDTTSYESSRDDLSHTPSNLMLVLQRISDRLTTVEALESQQLRKLDNIEYRLTKLEVVIQDKVSSIEKPENQIMRKLEDLDWEMNKFGTLLDVIRQDIDKVQQRQTEIKVAVATQNAQSPQTGRPGPLVGTGSTDFGSSSSALANADITAGIQTVASNVQSLRRLADSIQSYLSKIDLNVTQIHNITRNTWDRFEQLVTKQYFQIAMKEMFPQTLNPSLSLPSYFGYTKPAFNVTPLPRDCSEVVPDTGETSGIYQIQPLRSADPFFVFCDLETEGGGWTVFQRRQDGSIDFLREWLDYKHGFGNLVGEFWLGNEKLYHITNQAVYELRIELEDFSANRAYASYSSFALGSEIDGYMIKFLGQYEGTSGDSFTYHASMKFSTTDVDNDAWDGGHCAQMHAGGWWYKGCETANLNGKYLAGQTTEELEFQGVYWYEWHGPSYSLQKTEMKMRKKKQKAAAKLPAKAGKANKQQQEVKKKKEEEQE